MATWPESDPSPVYPLDITPRYMTIFSQFDSGKEQRRSKREFPVFDVVVRYRGITASEAETLWQFYLERQGPYEAFYIYDLALLENISVAHKGLYIGTGDGSTDIFDLPGRSTSSRTLYENGSVRSTGFSYLTGGGASSADRIDFTTPPSAGNVYSIDFTGFLRMRVRFDEAYTRQMFIRNRFNFEVKLKGLEAEA